MKITFITSADLPNDRAAKAIAERIGVLLRDEQFEAYRGNIPDTAQVEVDWEKDK